MLAENLCRQISQEFLSYGRLHIVSWALKRGISTTSCRNGWDRISGYQNIGTYFVNRRLIHSSPLKAKSNDMCKPVTEFHKFDNVEKHELEAAKWKPCEEELQGFHDEDMEIAKDVWKTKKEVEQLAIEILAARAYTTAELQKKLRSKNKYPADIISSVVTDLQNRGMLNDDLYAEIFSQSRWLSRSWGPKRIKQALLRKGVNEAIVNKATKDVFEDANVTKNEESSNVRLSKLSMDQLFAQAAKQWQRSQGKSPEARKSRMLRWLQYRGFDWGVTLTILKKLESEYPP